MSQGKVVGVCLKRILIPFLVGMLLVSAITFAALAVSETSNTRNFSEDGYSYQSSTVLSSNSRGVHAITIIGASSTVPSKNMWAQGRVYDDNGTLKAQGQGRFNSAPATALNSPYSPYYSVAGNYYAEGLTKVWNESESQYVEYDTYQTQFINYGG